MIRNRDWAMMMATDIFHRPCLGMEISSLRAKTSSPKTRRMMPRRQKATGTSATTLRPVRPSESRSTARPVAKAMNMAATVPRLIGMRSIMAGSIDSMTYCDSLKKLAMQTCTSSRMRKLIRNLVSFMAYSSPSFSRFSRYMISSRPALDTTVT